MILKAEVKLCMSNKARGRQLRMVCFKKKKKKKNYGFPSKKAPYNSTAAWAKHSTQVCLKIERID